MELPENECSVLGFIRRGLRWSVTSFGEGSDQEECSSGCDRRSYRWEQLDNDEVNVAGTSVAGLQVGWAIRLSSQRKLITGNEGALLGHEGIDPMKVCTG